jgi:hypothetical protein
MSEDAAAEWLGRQEQIASVDHESKTAVLRWVQDRVELGDVPDGWSIAVGWASNHIQRTVMASAVGSNVSLTLTGDPRSRFDIQGAFKRIVMNAAPRGGAGGTIRLRHSASTLVLPQGGYVLDGDGVECFVEASPGDGTTVLSGSAVIRDLRFDAGELTVGNPIPRDASILPAGRKLEFKQTLEGVSFDAPHVDVVAEGIADCNLLVASVQAASVRSSQVRAAKRIRVTGRVDGSHLEVLESVEGAALFVSDKQTGDPGPINPKLVIALPFENPPDLAAWGGRAGRAGAVTDSTLICRGCGDIVVSTATRAWIRCDRSLLVGGDMVVPADADGRKGVEVGGDAVLAGVVTLEDESQLMVTGSLSASSLDGSGDIRASTLFVRDGASAVTAKVEGAAFTGAMTGVALTATGLLSAGASDPASTLSIGGTAEVGDDFHGAITWEPSTPSTLHVSGTPASIKAKVPADAASTLTWGNTEKPVPDLDVTGRLVLTSDDTKQRRTKQVLSVPRLAIEPSAEVHLTHLGQANIESVTAGKDARLRLSSETVVNVSDSSGLHLECDSNVEVTVHRNGAGSETELALSVSGSGTVKVETTIDRLHADDAGRDSIQLNVPASGQILELTGGARLATVEGIVDGRTGTKAEKLWPWAKATEGTRAPRIYDIGDHSGPVDGVVVSVDPTLIPYSRLPRANDLQIFEPDPVAMIDFTRVKRSDLDRHTARRKAYQAERISQMVASSAASGGARSAANWAAARTHHQALQKAPVERALRLLHRMLGYSQRPAPPLVTYLTVVTAWTAAQWMFHEPRPGRGFGAFAGSWWHMALVPASFIARIPERTGDFDYLFDNLGWHTIAFVTMGLPLVFTFIALRHFMAAPAR